MPHSRLLSLLGLCGFALALLTGQSQEVYVWRMPSWVPAPVVPTDNPMTQAKVELGRHLFYDKLLSIDQSMSCSSCHEQGKAFTAGLALSRGVTRSFGHRNAMSLVNAAYSPVFTWANPQIASLEVQALIPIFGEHPIEMGMVGQEALLFDRLKLEPLYLELFAKAFPSEAAQGEAALFSLSTLTKALASFERSLLSFDSAYDRYKYGKQANAISPAAQRGEELFFGEKLECYHCHGGLNFTDNVRHVRQGFAEIGFHNTGLYNTDGQGSYPAISPGLSEFTGQAADRGKFKTPSLRNVAVTGPYMHDGSIESLEEVVEKHYAIAGRSAGTAQGKNPLRSEFIEGFQISKNEMSDLLAFLNSLTDEAFLKNPAFGDPWIKKAH